MRRLLLLSCTLALISYGCKNRNKNTSTALAQNTVTIAASLLTGTVLPRSIDLKQDISRYSSQESRLLCNYPYAIHGYHFMGADINAFFSANTKWYNDLIWKLWKKSEANGENKFPENYDEVKPAAEEEAFVERTGARIAETRQQQFTQRDPYYLGNASSVINLFQFKDINETLIAKLQQSNSAITEEGNLQLSHVYGENDYRQVPNLTTTDLYLQAFHVYFSYVLKGLEEQHIIPTLERLCLSLNATCISISRQIKDEFLKNVAEYAATFYAIPYYLPTKEMPNLPAKYQEVCQQETKCINAQEGNFSEFLSYKEAYFPYNLFKSCRHYTYEPQLQAYFQVITWLRAACFCREQQEQLKRVIFQATVLSTYKDMTKTPLMELYQRVYIPLTFLMGEASSLSLLNIAQILKKNKVEYIEDALTPAQVEKVDQVLIGLAESKNRIKPKIRIPCQNKINFMPQRYLADNEVFRELVGVTPSSRCAYPKGLNVFAAFGVNSAGVLLTDVYEEPDNWNQYITELQKLEDKFEASQPV